MGSFGIIIPYTSIHRLVDLRQITVCIDIQHLPAKGAVEPLDVRVLSRLTQLDPMQDYCLIGAPVLQGLTNKLRPPPRGPLSLRNRSGFP